MNILVVNCGSSSIKFQLISMEQEQVRMKGLVEKIGSEEAIFSFSSDRGVDKVKRVLPIKDHEKGLREIMAALVDPDVGVIRDVSEIQAVGHRTVHGGEEFNGSALITDEVIAAMERCTPFAPLHNPANIMGIRVAKDLLKVPHVGVFDTAFHSQMPQHAFMYGIPYEQYSEHGIRRYGFHGTSHKYVGRQAAEFLGKPFEECKLITCHLGNGSSIAAIKNGISVDTSMGFTPLEGLLMGTRCGDIDPAIVGFMAQNESLDIREVDAILNKKSGVLGLSGVSNDMREVEDAADAGNERAILALQVFYYRVTKYIGAYMTILGGADAIVFTGGIGENDPRVRRYIAEQLSWLGVELDHEANKVRGKVCQVARGPVKLVVIPTNEELAIAQETRAIVSAM